MHLNAKAYYQAQMPSLTHVRLYILAWISNGGTLVTDIPSDALVSLSVSRIGEYSKVVKTIGDLEFNNDAFLEASIGLDWVDTESDTADKLLSVDLTSPYGNVHCPLQRLPYTESRWARVFLESLRLGVLVMSGMSLDEIANLVTDKIRNGLQIVPANSNRFCVDTNPEVTPSWGNAVSFGFLSVGLSITNYGSIQIEFSFDGATRHGIVDAGFQRWFDFRRETQVFFRAATTDPLITVEAW